MSTFQRSASFSDMELKLFYIIVNLNKTLRHLKVGISALSITSKFEEWLFEFLRLLF